MTDALSITTDIGDDRTSVTVSGSRRVAVVVESDSGERIYLPPDRPDGPATDEGTSDSSYDGFSTKSPYSGMDNTDRDGVRADSPYEGMSEQTPYGSRATDQVGVTPTESGFRVIHPEPATDLRVLR